MNEFIYLIWLSILNLEPKIKLKLLEFFKTAKNVYNLNREELEMITSSPYIIEEILDQTRKEEAENIYNESLEKNIKIISHEDELYPDELKTIYNPPLILYLKGNYKLLKEEKKITIVGTRNNSEYGKMITQKFSYFLARKDYVIVSGLAKGIDSYAHKGALIAKGKTIAILGSGIEYVYPIENKSLYKKILDSNGLIISEYPLATRPKPEHFPARNRILSGISQKVLVTEAGKNSGSIITANMAIEQGKDVYSVPGNITFQKSIGTNQLIKDGAFLASTIEDITNL